MRMRIADIKERAKIRSDGYYDDIMSKGSVYGEFLDITPEAYRLLLQKYAPTTTTVTGSCCGGLKMPPITTQIWNVTKALGSVVSASVTGNPIKATVEKVMERKAICIACEFFDSINNKCSKCGCYYKTKIMVDSQKCPVGKW